MSALPNKYVTLDYSMIGLTALLIEQLGSNDTVSSLWQKVYQDERIRTFDRFADALTLGFSGGLLKLNDGIIELTMDVSRS